MYTVRDNSAKKDVSLGDCKIPIAMGRGGHADERDRLREELDALRVELLELAGTSRAWPLRRRLLAVIMPKQPIQ